MNDTEKYFIELLSSHINNKAPSPMENVKWSGIFKLAELHNVTAIISSQIKLLPEEYRPHDKGKSYFNQALGLTIQSYEEKIEAYNYFINVLNENKIKHLVVKGAVLRDLYPVPELRTSGDTDAVIDKSQFEQCGDLLIEKGFVVDQRTGVEDDLYYNNQFFELKRDFESINKKSEELFENPFSMELSYNNGYTYYLYPIYHLVYVTYHIMKHIKHGGAGVRQLMDICVLLNKCDIDIDRFLDIMKSLELEKSTLVILSICKKLFDVDINIDYSVEPELEEKLLETILQGGVFGYANGNIGTNRLANEISKSNKNSLLVSIKAFIGLFIISADYLYRCYPYARKHHILLPIAYFNRLYDATFKRGKSNAKNIKSMFKNQDNAIRLGEIINELEI